MGSIVPKDSLTLRHGSYRPESTFPTKVLHHRWIPVNFVKLFATALLYNPCEGLLFCILNFIVDSRHSLSISVEELFFVSFSLAGEWLRIDNEMTFRYFFSVILFHSRLFIAFMVKVNWTIIYLLIESYQREILLLMWENLFSFSNILCITIFYLFFNFNHIWIRVW